MTSKVVHQYSQYIVGPPHVHIAFIALVLLPNPRKTIEDMVNRCVYFAAETTYMIFQNIPSSKIRWGRKRVRHNIDIKF